MLLEFPEELERNNYMETLSRLYRIQYEDLRKMVNPYGSLPEEKH